MSPAGRDLTHAETNRLRGWEFCRECRTPYRMEDIVPVLDAWKIAVGTRMITHYLCRWHHARTGRK